MTTTPLTAEQLAAIRARFERTTHPDWRDVSDVGQLLAEVDRLTVALEVGTTQHAKAIAARDKTQRSAKTSDSIAAAEREVFREAIRDLGGDPVQVQNLYAQLASRTRQWEETKAELDRVRAEIAAATKLHAEVPLYLLAEDCPHHEPDSGHPEQGNAWAERHPIGMDRTGYFGDRICPDSPIGRSVCGTCLDPDCPEDPAPWPCTTATALGLAARPGA